MMPPAMQPQGGYYYPPPPFNEPSRRARTAPPPEDLDDEYDALEVADDRIDFEGNAKKRARPQKLTVTREARKKRTDSAALKGPPGDVSKELEESDEEVDVDHETDYKSPDSDEAGATKKAAEETFDLVTLGALASWTDQVVKSIGKDNLQPLLEISEIRGRLSTRSKEIILILAKLMGEVPSGEALTAKRLITHLAQLDALAGGGGPADSRLLPLLFQTDMEDFPLIRP